jgi:hypothetical protein
MQNYDNEHACARARIDGGCAAARVQAAAAHLSFRIRSIQHLHTGLWHLWLSIQVTTHVPHARRAGFQCAPARNRGDGDILVVKHTPVAPKVLNAHTVSADLDINNPRPLPLCSSSPKSIDERGLTALGAAEKDEASSAVFRFNSSLRRRRPSEHHKNVRERARVR